MERIASFNVDHVRLVPGLYVSRRDSFRDAVVTTFDIRMKKPNAGDYLSTTEAHTIEHLGATFLRNDPRTSESTVYFGPMGCRTGFYAVFFGDLESEDVAEIITEMFEFIASYRGTIPGQSEMECGNFRDLSMEGTRQRAVEYLEVLRRLDESTMTYPA